MRPTREGSRRRGIAFNGLGYNASVPTGDAPEPVDVAAGQVALVKEPTETIGAEDDLNASLGTVTSDAGNTHAFSNPANANDEDDLTYAGSESGTHSTSVVRALRSDLGSAQTVSSVLVRYVYGGSHDAPVLEHSPDGSTWTTAVGSWSAHLSSTRIFTLTSSISRRYWRITWTTVLGGLGFYPHLYVYTWAITGQALVAGDPVWSIARQLVDGDDATYFPEGDPIGGDVARLELDDTYLVASARMRIACENSGSKTYTIEGSNELDYSDAVELDSVTFTATGSYTAQDVAFTLPGTTAYSRYQITGPSESKRFHTFELFTAAPVTAGDIVTDHGGLTGLADDDHTLYVLTTEGGRDAQQAHGTLGSAENIDPTSGNVHTGTLDQDCTITLRPPATTRSGAASLVEVWLTEDGTGGWTPTFAASGGSIVWPGGSAPTHDTTADSLTRYVFETLDDGVTWYGLQVGSGGSSIDPATTVEAETTFGLSSAVGTDTEYARQDHTHGTPANPVTAAAVQAVGRWEPVTTNPGTGPELVWDGDDILVTFVETP